VVHFLGASSQELSRSISPLRASVHLLGASFLHIRVIEVLKIDRRGWVKISRRGSGVQISRRNNWWVEMNPCFLLDYRACEKIDRDGGSQISRRTWWFTNFEENNCTAYMLSIDRL
jgi:hypothetical protein